MRIWSFAYVDDIVLVANNRETMQDIMSFKKFLKERKLELSVDKSKLLVFNRKRKDKKEKWEWRGKLI